MENEDDRVNLTVILWEEDIPVIPVNDVIAFMHECGLHQSNIEDFVKRTNASRKTIPGDLTSSNLERLTTPSDGIPFHSNMHSVFGAPYSIPLGSKRIVKNINFETGVVKFDPYRKGEKPNTHKKAPKKK